MHLYTFTDTRTMKRKWDFGGEGCKVCQYRFECFTDDGIHIEPVKADLVDASDWFRTQDRFKLEFHLPLCLRLGLYKQIADTGFWTKSYRELCGDGFKLGAIFEDGDERITIRHSWVKFPNILYVTGTVR